MPTPHKHAAVIKAWADGHQIQFRRDNSEVWRDCDSAPTWHTYNEYRIKPNTIKYRNYLYRVGERSQPIVRSWNNPESYAAAEYQEGFVRWLGDWQEVEV